MTTLLLPFEGELSPAPQRRFEETVVFVHHFGGSKKTVSRHVKFVNDLGFNAVRFDLSFASFSSNHATRHLPLTADLKFGIRYIWTEQIEKILNSVPGRKIVYSFSMPSNSALMAISRRHARDVSSWVCDGGPFLQLPLCIWNLFGHEFVIENRWAKTAATALSLFMYGMGFERSVPRLLKALPKRFPILSIRGGEDPLVPISAIDDVFRHQERITPETLFLARGVHLDGLKNFPDAYTPCVTKFLAKHSTPS